jgi:hypothetical protein
MSRQYSGGIDTLKPLDMADDAHEAVGIWWARSILSLSFEAPGRRSDRPEARALAREFEIRSRDAAIGVRPLLEQGIGGFSIAVTDLSRQQNAIEIRVDYKPAPLLLEAARLSLGYPDAYPDDVDIFPYKATSLNLQDRVLAGLGERPARQVWPPLEPAA